MRSLPLAALAVSALWALPTLAQEGRRPQSLDECYLDVAARKGTADTVHLAREICDAVFQRAPRSLTVLQKNECVEWWFDAEGRYESADLYCSLEAAEQERWKLACQWKAAGKKYTFAELATNGGRLEPVGKLQGKSLGPLFTSLGACIEHRANGAAGS